MTTSSFDGDKLLEAIVSKTKNRDVFAFPANATIVPRMVDGDVGIELEIEANTPFPTDGFITVKGKRSGARWNAITDGSLRGHSREFVLSTAAFIDEVPELLKGLFDSLAEHKVDINNSNRCSTHVHVNMADKKINHLTSTILLWSVFENAIIRWCGEERVTNHFCLSLQDSSSVVNTWAQLLKGNSLSVIYSNNNLKYSALNIRPFPDRGSFEFRCGRGADEPQYPLQFAYLVKTLVDHACETYENPLLIASHLSERGAATMLQDIFARQPAVLTSSLLSDIIGDSANDFNNEALVSFRNVQALAYSHDWFELLKDINRPFVPNPFGNKKSKTASGIIDEYVRVDDSRPSAPGDRWATPPDAPRILETIRRTTTINSSSSAETTRFSTRHHSDDNLPENHVMLVDRDGRVRYNKPPLLLPEFVEGRRMATTNPVDSTTRRYYNYFTFEELGSQGYISNINRPETIQLGRYYYVRDEGNQRYNFG